MSLEEAQNDIVNVLDRQTIKGVRRECNSLAAEKDLPRFSEFLQDESQFIVTQKRAEILRGVQQGLADRESPGVILHGAYGSGKTVIMEHIEELCDASQQFDGAQYDQLLYGSTPIDCITISLEQNDTPQEFLYAIFTKLVAHAETLSEQDLVAQFNDKKLGLTIEDLDESLPDRQRRELIDRYEDPDSLEDIALVVKSLTAGEAHKPIAWFTSHYRDEEGHYPALYIDEFEQLLRQGIAMGGNYRLKAIVQKMIRKAVAGFEDLEHPPYILFANTLALDELKEEFNAERDLIDRITESVSYNIDLSEQETKELFARLYRLYVIPLLADRDGDAAAWYDTITTADYGEDGYVYPFTEDTLEFALQVVHTVEEEDRGETVVRAFRDYKRILITFLSHWDGDGVIDPDFLYRHGDTVRDQLRGRVERVDHDAIPGEASIEETINADYAGISGLQRRVLAATAKDGILNRRQSPAYFSTEELKDIADSIEIRLETAEAEDLIAIAAEESDYFAVEEDRLAFKPDELTGIASGEEKRSLSDQVGEAVNDLNLREQSVISLWHEMIEHNLGGDIENQQDRFLVFDTAGDLNYTNKVYLTVEADDLPEQLQSEVTDEALQFTVRLGRDEDGDLPARFHVSERNGRAEEITDDIADSFNGHIKDHIEGDSIYAQLLDAIEERYTTLGRYEQYLIFLKLSLARHAGNNLPEDIRYGTAEQRSFAIIQTVDNKVTGVANTYARKKLGLSGSYTGRDILTLIYGIKHLKREGELIYENPNHPLIDVRSFGNVNRSKESGEGFREIVSSFEEHETFIEDEDLVPSFGAQTTAVLDDIKDALAESGDGLDFDAVVECIFSTREVDNVAKAMVYLLLVLGEYWDDRYQWLFEDDDDRRIVSASTRLDTQRQTARNDLAEAIRIELLDQAKSDAPDSSRATDLMDKYGQLDDDSLSRTEIEDLIADVEEIDAEWDLDFGSVEDSLRDLVSEDVFADTDVASYLNAVRNLSEREQELVYLIVDDLEHVVDQAGKAQDVLQKKDDLDQHVEKLEWFGIDPEIDSSNLEINCIQTIEDHWQSNRVEQELNEAEISGDIESYLTDDVTFDRLIGLLQNTLSSIVPDVETYEAADDLETVEDDLEYVTGELRDAISAEEETVEAAQSELAGYERRIPEGESGWLRRGETHLENCKSELDSSPANFDHDQYSEYWEQWQRAKQNIEEVAFDDAEFEDAVRNYDRNMDSDSVSEAEEEGIDDKFIELPEETFKTLVASLNSEDEAAEELKRSLIKLRVKAELTGSTEESEDS